MHSYNDQSVVHVIQIFEGLLRKSYLSTLKIYEESLHKMRAPWCNVLGNHSVLTLKVSKENLSKIWYYHVHH